MADETIEVKLQLIDNMSNEIKATRAAVESNLTRMRQEADKAKSGFGQFTSQLKSGLASAVSFLGPAALAATSVTTAFKAMGQAMKMADTLTNMNQKLGISTDLLQRLDIIAKQSGSSIEAMTMGFKTFQTVMVDASKEGSKQEKIFNALGVSLKDVNGNSRDVESVFRDVIKALRGIDNQQLKVATATELFGRTALDIIPAIKELDESYTKLSKNNLLSEEEIKRLDDAGDAWTRFWNKIVVGTGKAMAKFLEYDERIKNSPTYKLAYGQASSAESAKRSLLGGHGTLDPEAWMPTWKQMETNSGLAAAVSGAGSGGTKSKRTPYIATYDESIRLIKERDKKLVEGRKQVAEALQKIDDERLGREKKNQNERDELARREAEITQFKNDVIYTGSMDIIRSMNAATTAIFKNATQRKAAALIETAAYGGVSSALAWKEAFAQKDTGGFYGKLAAAIIGTGAAIANMVVAIANINKYARGGSVRSGYAIVGEEGPELVRFGGGAAVMTAGATRQIMNDNRKSEATFIFNDTNGREIERIRAQVRNGSADALVSDLRARMKLQAA
jgi:hypothetical protein